MRVDVTESGAMAALLRLQMEWGVDVLVDEQPQDRFAQSREERERSLPVDVPPQGEQVPARPASRPPPAPLPVAQSVPDLGFLRGLETVDALAAAIDGFSGFSLRSTATTTVLPRGPVGARVMVIGDTPDEDEDRSGIPFSGVGGQYLDRMLASIGLTRKELVVASAIPWRPPGGRPPSPAEVAVCLPLLLASISLFRPQRLLLCGGLAVRMMFGSQANPLRLRGKWRDTQWDTTWGPQRPALAMRHPLQLRAGARARREIWHDLLLLSVTLDDEAGIISVMAE